MSLGPPADWSDALRAATSGPLAVPLLVIDELPYLLDHSPELESVLQHVADNSRDGGGTSVVLCGSSLSIMGGLLGGGRPLRGRADLQLRLEPFDYRTSAVFWQAADPSVAFRLDAIVGGLPGYRSLARGAPTTTADFDDWVTEQVLAPSSALLREDDYLLGEDRRVGDRSIYRSVLAAIASGEHRPSRIAGRVGRVQTSLTSAFKVLIEAGFVVNDAGLLASQDPLYRIADPIVTFLAACAQPWKPLIEEGRGRAAWQFAQPAWRSQVLGPHLERLARVWASRFASAKTLGGEAGLVGRAEVADPTARMAREIDVVVLQPGAKPGPSVPVLAIGECKLHATTSCLQQLDRAAEVLVARGHGTPLKRLLFAETWSPELEPIVSARPDVELVNLERLYAGT